MRPWLQLAHALWLLAVAALAGSRAASARQSRGLALGRAFTVAEAWAVLRPLLAAAGAGAGAGGDGVAAWAEAACDGY